MSKYFDKIVQSPVNVERLADLVQYSFDVDENFADYVELKKVKDGDPIGYIGDLETIGKKGAGCNPTFDSVTFANGMKRWSLGDWQAPLKFCYTDLEGTVAEYCLKTGTDIADLTTTEFTDNVLEPLLERALKKMVWRIGWFNDPDAKTIENGGTLTNGIDLDKFTITTGLWKRIFTQCTSNAKQLTAIAANTEKTLAAQKAAILKEGVATDLFDQIMMDADSRIVDDSDAMIICTRALGDALTHDIKKVHHVIMPWEKVFDGVDVTTYNGVKIAKISIWDRQINAYENTGNVLNKPFRAVFANKKQLMMGCPADSIISSLNIWYEKKDRMMYVDCLGKLGTNLLEDDMFQAAY